MNTPPISNSIPFENVQRGASTINYVEVLISFLEENLATFSTEKKPTKEQAENDITELLYEHLTRKVKFNEDNIEYPFVFQPEKSQRREGKKGHSKRVDIAARLNTFDSDLEVIYCIEAKKLPTDKVDGKRETEYVLGEGGAIERFKQEAHGLDKNGRLLESNGIVAYITDNTFEHWHSQINSWISSPSEHLQKEYFSSIGRLKSTHVRISGANLFLTHFWVRI